MNILVYYISRHCLPSVSGLGDYKLVNRRKDGHTKLHGENENMQIKQIVEKSLRAGTAGEP